VRKQVHIVHLSQLSFAEVQAAVDIEPAFPTWVESGDDPPDCALELPTAMEAPYTVIEAPQIFIRPTTALQWSTETRISTTHNAFVYTPYVSAGGVGRLYGSFCLVISNPAAHNNSFHVLNGTSGGMGRIQG